MHGVYVFMYYSVCGVIMCGLSVAFLSFDLFLRIVIRRQTLDYYVTSVIAKFPLYIYFQLHWDNDDFRPSTSRLNKTKTTSKSFLA